MTKPRYRPPPPGRTAWPGVFVYLTADGIRHCCPPAMNEDRNGMPTSQPYEFEIHDLARFEELGRTGEIYSDAHCGQSAPAEDNGRTA